MTGGSSDSGELRRRIEQGDVTALRRVASCAIATGLKRMVKLRLDRRLRGRLDPSDVLQEAYLDFARRRRITSPPRRCRSSSGSLVAGKKLWPAPPPSRGPAARRRPGGLDLSRRVTAGVLGLAGGQLLGRLTSPTQAAQRAEMQLKIQEALNAMDRSTARSSRCGTSRNSATPRRPRCWASARRRPATATSGP